MPSVVLLPVRNRTATPCPSLAAPLDARPESPLAFRIAVTFTPYSAKGGHRFPAANSHPLQHVFSSLLLGTSADPTRQIGTFSDHSAFTTRGLRSLLSQRGTCWGERKGQGDSFGCRREAHQSDVNQRHRDGRGPSATRSGAGEFSRPVTRAAGGPLTPAAAELHPSRPLQ